MSPHSSGRPPQQVSVRNAEQLPQPGDPRSVDDLASLPRRLRQAGTFERGEMEGHGRSRHRQASGDVSGRNPRPLGHEQAQQVEPSIHGQGGKGGGGFRCFHVSSLAEMTTQGKRCTVAS